MRLYRTANRTYAGATDTDLNNPAVIELLAVHDMFKRELQKLAEFVEQLLEAQGTLPQGQVARHMQTLAQAMYQYTTALHAHHGGETEAVFPALEPFGLEAEIVERLNREHDDLAVLLDRLDGALDLQGASLAPDVQRDLERLAKLLRDHLDYEEEHVCPLLPKLGGWPEGIQEAWQRSHERSRQSAAAKAFAEIAEHEEAQEGDAVPERGLRTGFVAGAAITPSAMEIDQAFRMASLADQLGYDMVAVQDHPYNPQFVDTWTLLTAMTLYTQNVHLATDVANLGVRPPAMLLKAATTLQMLSGGRVILGVGGGVSDGAVSGFGGLQVDSARDLGDAFAEALELLQQLQSAQGRAVTYPGKHHTLRNAQFGPALSIHTPIWTGAMKPRGLRLTGQFADGWFIPLNSYVADAELPALQKQVDDAAVAAGRDPKAIRRVRNLAGYITPDGMTASGRKGALVGPISLWIETLTRYVSEYGVDGVVFWPAQDQERQIAEFAELVLPEVRGLWAAQ